MIRLASFIVLGTLAALMPSGMARAGSVVIPGSPVIVTPPPAAPPVIIEHRRGIARPVIPPAVPVIIVPPTLAAPSGLVTQPVVIRQGHRLFLVAPGVFVPLN